MRVVDQPVADPFHGLVRHVRRADTDTGADSVEKTLRAFRRKSTWMAAIDLCSVPQSRKGDVNNRACEIAHQGMGGYSLHQKNQRSPTDTPIRISLPSACHPCCRLTGRCG